MDEFFKSKLNVVMVASFGLFLFFALLGKISNIFMLVSFLCFIVFLFVFSYKLSLKYKALKNSSIDYSNLSLFQARALEVQKSANLRSMKWQIISLYVLCAVVLYVVLDIYIF